MSVPVGIDTLVVLLVVSPKFVAEGSELQDLRPVQIALRPGLTIPDRVEFRWIEFRWNKFL